MRLRLSLLVDDSIVVGDVEELEEKNNNERRGIWYLGGRRAVNWDGGVLCE